MRCAFLTADDLTGYVTDDHLAVAALRARGHEVSAVSWRDGTVDWSRFDGAVIRTTWDYHRAPDLFLDRLDGIAGVTRLANPLDLVRWNLRKTYLRELAERGVPVPRTVWLEPLGPGDVATLFDRLDADEVVVKPVVGASGEDTYRLRRGDSPARREEVERVLRGRDVLAQPFLGRVLRDGELGVVYVAGRPVHTVLKRAAPGEYRVQEEHGGTVRRIDPPDGVLDVARRAVGWLGAPAPLYARVDLLRGDGGEWLVGELELIEPALYLRVAPDSVNVFADAIESWLG